MGRSCARSSASKRSTPARPECSVAGRARSTRPANTSDAKPWSGRRIPAHRDPVIPASAAAFLPAQVADQPHRVAALHVRMCAASSASAPLALTMSDSVPRDSANGRQLGHAGAEALRGSSDNAAASRAHASPSRSRYHAPASSAIRQVRRGRPGRSTWAQCAAALRRPPLQGRGPSQQGGGDIRRRCL